jgi:ribosome modulation factor
MATFQENRDQALRHINAARRGRKEATAGKTLADNPYQDLRLRDSWMSGWHTGHGNKTEARTAGVHILENLLGGAFKR